MPADPAAGRPRTREIVRSAARATVATTAVFVAGYRAGDVTITTYATFAVVSALLFADFPGTARIRATSYLALAVAGMGFVSLGTLASASLWISVPASFAVVLAVQTLSAVGGPIVVARMPLLLAWVLPVTLGGSAADVGPRVLGWLIGGLAAMIAGLLLWPRHGTGGLRQKAAERARALAAALTDPAAPPMQPMAPIPTRPYGIGARDHELLGAVEALNQLGSLQAGWPEAPQPSDRLLREDIGTALDLTGRLLGGDRPARTEEELQALALAREQHLARLVDEASQTLRANGGDPDPVLDRFLGVFALRITAIGAIDAAVRAERATRPRGRDTSAADLPLPTLDNVPGLATEHGLAGAGRRAWRLLTSVLAPGSVWLRASMRAAVGVSLAVLIAGEASLSHSFWIVLGTLSVLRSNAFATGRTYLQAMLGTVIGFALSIGLLGLQDATAWPYVLWVAFPVTVFLSAYAPTALHYVAGQAAFTLFVVVMFGLLEPPTWQTGLVRIEDVAVGGAVSVVVGLLLWPRGARHILRDEIARLYRASAEYLAAALARMLGTPDEQGRALVGACHHGVVSTQWRAEAAFQQYQSERRTTDPPASDWVPVIAGGTQLRLAADMLERSAEFRVDPPSATVFADMAAAADRAVAATLVHAEELAIGRTLRLGGALPPAAARQARTAAATALREWGGDPAAAQGARTAIAVVFTYAWLKRLRGHWARLPGLGDPLVPAAPEAPVASPS